MNQGGVVIFCEKENLHGFGRNTFELLTIGRELADKTGGTLTAVSFEPFSDLIKDLSLYGADRAIFSNHRKAGVFDLESDSFAASQIIRNLNPEIVLFSATDYGRVLAPKVAAGTRCGITADCTDFKINEAGKLVQIRPALGGNILAHIISPETVPQMATVRPGVFKMKECFRGLTEYSEFNCEIPDIRRTVFEKNRISAFSDEFVKIEDARIVVSAGRGIRSKEILKKIEHFAQNIGGVCACSRRIVESGWMNHSSQVGQSGKTISPEIYIAIGISGAVQHLAGMKTSSKIIAVNSDPNAEIFSVAHIGFVMDAEEWIDKAADFLRKNG